MGAGYPVTGRPGWVGDNPGLPRVGLAVDVIGTADEALYLRFNCKEINRIKNNQGGPQDGTPVLPLSALYSLNRARVEPVQPFQLGGRRLPNGNV